MKYAITCCLLAVSTLSGCASIMNDQTQQVTVRTSNGTAVKGTVNGAIFAAPSTISLTRESKNKIFMTETEGCDRETVLEKSVDPKFFGNLLLGGLPGSTTDAATEKMWKYSDDVVIRCQK